MSPYAIEGHHQGFPTGLVCRGPKPRLAAPFRISVDIDHTVDEEFVVADVTDVDGEHFCFETTTPAEQLPARGVVTILGRQLATLFGRLRYLGGARYELLVVHVYATRVTPLVHVVDVIVGGGYVMPARLDARGKVRRKELPIIDDPTDTVQTLHIGLLRGVLRRIPGLPPPGVDAIVDAARRACR